MGTAFINSSVALFSLCAQLIMFLFVFFTRNEQKQKPLFKNAFLAFTTLAFFVICLVRPNIEQVESLVLFTIAVSTALILIAKDQQEGPIPKWMEMVHNTLSVAGFIFVLFSFTH